MISSKEDLESIKNKIHSSATLTETEKQEWLFLLPKMSSEQIEELERILSIKIPVTSKQAGIKEESNVAEAFRPPLANSEQRLAISKIPQSPDENLYRSTIEELKKKHQEAPPPSPNYQLRTPKLALPQIAELNELKSLSVQDLKRAPSLKEFLQEVAAKMQSAIRSRIANFEQVVMAFEQSSLIAAYLDAGLRLLSPHPSSPTRGEEMKEGGGLSRQEFEAIADFRASLKKILNPKS